MSPGTNAMPPTTSNAIGQFVSSARSRIQGSASHVMRANHITLSSIASANLVLTLR